MRFTDEVRVDAAIKTSQRGFTRFSIQLRSNAINKNYRNASKRSLIRYCVETQLAKFEPRSAAGVLIELRWHAIEKQFSNAFNRALRKNCVNMQL